MKARGLTLLEHFMVTAVLGAVLVAIFGALSCSVVDRSLHGNTEVRITVADRNAVHYSFGRWWDGTTGKPLSLRVHCPTEDACALQWNSATTGWVVRLSDNP